MTHHKRHILSPFAEYAKFGATGVINTSVDFAILNLLLFFVTSTPQNIEYAAFKTFSFLGAVSVSYVLNRSWVFSHQTQGQDITLKESSKFFLISIIGLLVNVSVSFLVFSAFETLGKTHPALSANISSLIATIFTIVWNYTGYKFFVFRSEITERIS